MTNVNRMLKTWAVMNTKAGFPAPILISSENFVSSPTDTKAMEKNQPRSVEVSPVIEETDFSPIQGVNSIEKTSDARMNPKMNFGNLYQISSLLGRSCPEFLLSTLMVQ